MILAALAACRLDDRPVIIDDAAGSGGFPDAPTCLPRTTNIPPAKIHGNGETYTGENCKTGGCHASPVTGGDFIAAGTLLTPERKGDGGAYFLFSPAANPQLQLQVAADAAGNFWVSRQDQVPVFPAFVGITACPTTKFMPFAIDGTEGSCNGCHNDTNPLGPLIIDG